MSQLYEITGRLKEIATVETEDQDFALALRDTLEGIEGEFNDKAVSVSHAILNLDSDAEAIDREVPPPRAAATAEGAGKSRSARVQREASTLKRSAWRKVVESRPLAKSSSNIMKKHSSKQQI